MWSPTVYSDELYHHGIKGQKWGTRHYQNEDGSLTPAGRERYGRGLKERLLTHPSKSYTSSTTRKLRDAYGKNAANTKRSEEFDKRISEKYADDVVHTGRNIAKNLLLGPTGTMTWNMSRAMGESKGKAFVRTVFDINISNLISTAADNAVTNTISGGMTADNFDFKAVQRNAAIGRMAGRATGDAVGAITRNTGSELSLQQRLMRGKYVKGKAPVQKKRKKT